MGENLLKRTGLRPNWDKHDAATCPIINYFADRNNTAFILVKQEMKLEKTATFAIYAKTVKDLKNAELNSKKWVFGHLTSI